MTSVRVYAVVSGSPDPRRFDSLSQLEEALKATTITSIQYTQATEGTTVPTTYVFHHSGEKLVAYGQRGYDGDTETQVPPALIAAVTPLTFVSGAPIGLIVEDEPGGLSIKAYGVTDPLAAVKAVLAALVEIQSR